MAPRASIFTKCSLILTDALNTGPFPIGVKDAILGLLMHLFMGFAAKSVEPLGSAAKSVEPLGFATKSVEPLGFAAEDRFTDKLPIDGDSSFRPVDLVRFGDCMD